jgi:hypothetical protein
MEERRACESGARAQYPTVNEAEAGSDAGKGSPAAI